MPSLTKTGQPEVLFSAEDTELGWKTAVKAVEIDFFRRKNAWLNAPEYPRLAMR